MKAILHVNARGWSVHAFRFASTILTGIFLLILNVTVKAQPEQVRNQVKVVKLGSVNFMEAERLTKAFPDTARYKPWNGPVENTEFKETPVPEDADIIIIKTAPGFRFESKEKPLRDKEGSDIDEYNSEINLPGLGLDSSSWGPPDIAGASNENYIVEVLNTDLGIYNKYVNQLRKANLNKFFQPLVTGTMFRVVDPHILYDPFEKRWLLTVLANDNAHEASLYIAVSDTDDPTGTWGCYATDVDSANHLWLDYPAMGFNKRWVAISGNMYPLSGEIANITRSSSAVVTTIQNHRLSTGDSVIIGGVKGMTELNGKSFAVTVTGPNSFSLNVNSTSFKSYTANGNWVDKGGRKVTAQLYLFNKEELYNYTLTNALIYYSNHSTLYPVQDLDNINDTLSVVFSINGNDKGYGYLGYYKIFGSFATPNLTNKYIRLPVTWRNSSIEINFAPQKDSKLRINTNDARMCQPIMRNGTVWCAHTVFLPADNPAYSAIQWYQINSATCDIRQYGRIDDGAQGIFYAYPSIAVNAYDDAVVGFSSFSSSQYPSSSYAYRFSNSPEGTMSVPVTFANGISYFESTKDTNERNRWGDYSSTFSDPDLFSFWTIQEYSRNNYKNTVSQWGTEIEHVVLPVPELYIKDRAKDSGAEPNPSQAPMWQTEDIWLRNTRDSLHRYTGLSQQPVFRKSDEEPDYIYVRVHNRGGMESKGTERLNLYWAISATALDWGSFYMKDRFFDPPVNTMPKGGFISSIPVPVIEPGGYTILEFPWTPPDPGIYSLPSISLNKNNFSFLARITESTLPPYGMTYLETYDVNKNVRENNNIAWKNVKISDLHGADSVSYAMIHNLSFFSTGIRLKFHVINSEGEIGLIQHGVLRVLSVGDFKTIMKNARFDERYVRNLGNGDYEILADEASLYHIDLPGGYYGTLAISFIPDAMADIEPGYAITVIQDQTYTGQRSGGQTFVFGEVKGFTAGTAGSPGTSHWPGWMKWFVPLFLGLTLILILLFRFRDKSRMPKIKRE